MCFFDCEFKINKKLIKLNRKMMRYSVLVISFFSLVLLYNANQIEAATIVKEPDIENEEVAEIPKFTIAKPIKIEGKIVKGDFEKLKSLLVSYPDQNFIEINSPGGDVIEAIKIGNLIRNAHVSVEANLHCYSACFLIYASAMKRSGSQNLKFGLHRAYFDKEYFKGLDSQTAQIKYKELESIYIDYLQQVRVPRNVIDKLMQYSSDEAWVLSGKEVEDMIGGTDAAFEELILASCEHLTKLEKRDFDRIMKSSVIDPFRLFAEGNIEYCMDVSGVREAGFSVGYCKYLANKMDDSSDCENRIIKNARAKFYKKIQKARIAR